MLNTKIEDEVLVNEINIGDEVTSDDIYELEGEKAKVIGFYTYDETCSKVKKYYSKTLDFITSAIKLNYSNKTKGNFAHGVIIDMDLDNSLKRINAQDCVAYGFVRKA